MLKMLENEFYCIDTLNNTTMQLMNNKNKKLEDEKKNKKIAPNSKSKFSSRAPIFCFNLSVSVVLIVLFYLILIAYSLGSLYIM